jgi:hypothetical protein
MRPKPIVLLCLLCFCLTIHADSTTGTITGIVLDAQGNPAKDCIVVAQQSAEKMRDTYEATTDEKGAFKLENVPGGEYNLKARTRDLKAKATKTVTVIAGKTADVGKLKLKGK